MINIPVTYERRRVSKVSGVITSTQVFQQFYCKLVKTLPMYNLMFIAELYRDGLLPGDLKSQLKSEKTSADKAVLFLDSVIEPRVTSDGGSSFDKLLHVMEDSEYQQVKELAEQIRISLTMRSSSNKGKLFKEPALYLVRSNVMKFAVILSVYYYLSL